MSLKMKFSYLTVTIVPIIPYNALSFSIFGEFNAIFRIY